MKKYQYITSVVIFLIILASIFLVLTKPIEDGDLWWQMSYGKQMLERGTLIPDHAIYTWTPTRSEDIYCAWIAEIFLYTIHSFFGMIGLYFLRYLLPVILITIIYMFARKLKVAANPLTGLAAVFFILSAGSPISFIKPEMFSFLFMSLAAMLWFIIRLRDLEERSGSIRKQLSSDKLVYFFPLIFLFWVNTHGGFIFGLPLLALVFIGDLINMKYNPGEALSSGTRKHLFIASILSGIALFITPYGYKYPLSLVMSVATQSIKELKTVEAYSASLESAISILYFIIKTAVLLFLFAASKKRKKPDAVLIMINLFYAFLYTLFLRTTYFWAPVFVFSAVWLIKDEDFFDRIKRPILKAVYVSIVLIFAIYLCWAAVYGAIVNNRSWLGYGNYYLNSPEETDYIKSRYRDLKIGNIYGNGGYLLWRLGPETKIMIDPRYFPFKNWYSRYLDFQSGKNIDEFLNEFDADIFVIQYSNINLYTYFLTSPDWQLSFYGSGGPIFVKNHINNQKKIEVGQGLFTLQSVQHAKSVFKFLVTIRDWDSSEKIIKNIQKNSRWDWEQEVITNMQNYNSGFQAYYIRDYKTAIKNLELCGEYISGFSLANTILQRSYNIYAVDFWTAGDFTEALRLANKALLLNSENPYSHFNCGVIRWWILRNSSHSPVTGYSDAEKNSYKKNLKKFLEITKNMKEAEQPRKIAEMILNGTYTIKPPLIHPPEPK